MTRFLKKTLMIRKMNSETAMVTLLFFLTLLSILKLIVDLDPRRVGIVIQPSMTHLPRQMVVEILTHPLTTQLPRQVTTLLLMNSQSRMKKNNEVLFYRLPLPWHECLAHGQWEPLYPRRTKTPTWEWPKAGPPPEKKNSDRFCQVNERLQGCDRLLLLRLPHPFDLPSVLCSLLLSLLFPLFLSLLLLFEFFLLNDWQPVG